MRQGRRCGICGKVGYTTRERAEAAARMYERLHRTKQRVYRGKCGWFHLASVRGTKR